MHLLLSRRVVATRLVFGKAHSCLYDIIIALFLLAFFLAATAHGRILVNYILIIPKNCRLAVLGYIAYVYFTRILELLPPTNLAS